MGRVIDRREYINLKELIYLLENGFGVTHEVGGKVTLFLPSMKRHQVILARTKCEGGTFAVRELSKTA